jgi:hypothetical protein
MARREFSMLAQLGSGHLNIVRPLEVVLTSKFLVLITEYVPGKHFTCLGAAAVCSTSSGIIIEEAALTALLQASRTLYAYHTQH